MCEGEAVIHTRCHLFNTVMRLKKGLCAHTDEVFFKVDVERTKAFKGTVSRDLQQGGANCYISIESSFQGLRSPIKYF